MRELTPGDVANLMRSLQAERKSPSTAARVRATLSRVLSDAMRHELVHRNVAQMARPPRAERVEPSAFSQEEFDRMITV